MTLHEAIEMILQETGRPMTSNEIAKIVNERNLYTRRDKLPVSASQITARVGNYEKIFIKEFGKIKLVKDDIVSLKLQEYKNKISNTTNKTYNKGEVLDPQIILKVLKDLEDDSFGSLENDVVKESPLQYNSGQNEITIQDKLEITYKLFQWYLFQTNPYEVMVPDQLTMFLSGLYWFKSGNHKIVSSVNFSIHYLLKIAYENPKSNFVVNKDHGDYKSQENPIQNINDYIIDLFLRENLKIKKDNSFKLSTGVFKLHFFNRNERNNELEALLTRIDLKALKLDRAVIILPTHILHSRRRDDLSIKQRLIESGYLDSVIRFSNDIFNHTNISVAVFILDFSKTNKEVFFFDATSKNVSSSVNVFNNKIEVRNESHIVPIEDIVANGFDLTIGRYVYKPELYVLESGYELYDIGSLILDTKRGVAIPKRKLYEKGEYKVLRTSEIDENSYYFSPSNTVLGVDHDEVRNIENHLVSDGVVISAFNKKVKANILPKDDVYLLGQDTFWLNLNNEKVLEEYFVRELTQDYVRNQVEHFSKGIAIMRLNLEDLLKIKIKLPSSPEQQRALVLESMQLEFKKSKNQAVHSGLDFINTLEHSLKQPASGLGSDLASLRTFITKKIESRETLSMEDSVVPLFPTDTPEQIAAYTLNSTLERMYRAVTDIEYIIKQARHLTTAKAKTTLTLIDLKSFLETITTEHRDINIRILGKTGSILADRKQLRVLFNNFIDNAKRHGFKEMTEEPTIWIEINSKNKHQVQISIRNNGKPLPAEFCINDFLAKGKSSEQEVGSGFGGFLIGQILKNHGGEVSLTDKANLELTPYKVEFVMTLPK